MLHPSPYPSQVPREGGDPDEGQPVIGVLQVWTPACAGDADERKQDPLPRLRRYFPQRGKI